MGEIAENIQTDPLALEGLEDLLEDSSPTPPPTVEDPRDVCLELPPPKIEDTSLGWTLKQAAKSLGISVNTVRKRLLSGQLEGLKVESPYGYEWRIYPPANSHAETSPKVEDTPPSPLDSPHPIVEGTPTDRLVVDYSEPSVDRLLGLLESHVEMIKELHAELTRKDHIIEQKDEQLKLLTDSRHKRGWFQRFSNWFLGRRSS